MFEVAGTVVGERVTSGSRREAGNSKGEKESDLVVIVLGLVMAVMIVVGRNEALERGNLS